MNAEHPGTSGPRVSTGEDSGPPSRTDIAQSEQDRRAQVTALARITAARAAAESRAAAHRSTDAARDLRERQRRLRSAQERLAAIRGATVARLATSTAVLRRTGTGPHPAPLNGHSLPDSPTEALHRVVRVRGPLAAPGRTRRR